jgi:CheY-like chemotaxis protein
MPRGGSLEVRVALAPAAGDDPERVCLAVRDTGVGIPAELQSRVFDPFFTTKPVGQGTGLGLSQVYGIVGQHGGTIELDSELGVGTEVRVWLPVLSRDGGALGAAPAPSAAPAVTARTGLRVLLVEDELVVLELARRHFQLFGVEVVTARNGRQALELLAQHGPFDLVVSDLVMPEVGGLELLREVRRRWPGTPVVLMSGYARFDVEGEAQPDGWLHKPFTGAQLDAVLGEALQAGARARERRAREQASPAGAPGR